MTRPYIDHAHRHRPGGTDPLGLAAGDEFNIKVFGDEDVAVVGDGAFIFAVPSDLNGSDLIDVGIYVTTPSSSGLPTVQIRNVTQSNVDMLTTKATVKVGEKNSYGPGSTATPPVIDTANDDVATGDHLAIDVDVAGTGAKGLGVILVFSTDPPGRGAKGETGATGATGPPGTNGTNGTNGAISLIEDEGGALTVRPTINFVGAGVTAADAGGKTVVTIPGGGAIVQLYDNIAAGAIASWDVSGIVATYAHLIIRMQARGSAAIGAVNAIMRFNGDTGANYDGEYLHGVLTTPSSGALVAQTSAFIGFVSAASATADRASTLAVDITNYASTVFQKTYLASSLDMQGITGASLSRTLASGGWRNTAAINRITILPASGNWVAGSRLSIYGIL